jgi:hypothetical protein
VDDGYPNSYLYALEGPGDHFDPAEAQVVNERIATLPDGTQLRRTAPDDQPDVPDLVERGDLVETPITGPFWVLDVRRRDRYGLPCYTLVTALERKPELLEIPLDELRYHEGPNSAGAYHEVVAQGEELRRLFKPNTATIDVLDREPPALQSTLTASKEA